MRLSQAWLDQIESDYDALDTMTSINKQQFHCQCIAKSQQVVEKSIKLMDLVTQEMYSSDIAYDRSHLPRAAIKRLLYMPPKLAVEFESPIRIFLLDNRSDIEDLCELAPALPGGDDGLRKNTEYPYNLPDGTWTSPSLSFTGGEVRRHLVTARRTRSIAQRVVSSATRLTLRQ